MEQANYIIILKKALRDVINQNDKLQMRVKQLDQVITEKDVELEAKDKAIAELYMVLDLQMNGELTQKAFETVQPEEGYFFSQSSHSSVPEHNEQQQVFSQHSVHSVHSKCE